jgi:hypothetical protein
LGGSFIAGCTRGTPVKAARPSSWFDRASSRNRSKGLGFVGISGFGKMKAPVILLRRSCRADWVPGVGVGMMFLSVVLPGLGGGLSCNHAPSTIDPLSGVVQRGLALRFGKSYGALFDGGSGIRCSKKQVFFFLGVHLRFVPLRAVSRSILFSFVMMVCCQE